MGLYIVLANENTLNSGAHLEIHRKKGEKLNNLMEGKIEYAHRLRSYLLAQTLTQQNIHVIR